MSRRLRVLCIAVVLAGCGNEFRSLNPIALPDDRSPVPGLAGDWAVLPEDDFEGGIVRLIETGQPVGRYLILDVCQEPAAEDADLLLPLHTPVYLDGAGSDTLTLATLVGREFEAFLRQEPASLAHSWIRSTPASTDSILVVTASTADIRRFIGRYQARTNAIDHEAPITLRRLR